MQMYIITWSQWPDVEQKVAQMFPKVTKKQPQQFLHLSEVFKLAQKVTNNLGYFWKKFSHQELSKIAKFGHTDNSLPAS